MRKWWRWGLPASSRSKALVHRLGTAVAKQIAQFDALIMAEAAEDGPRRCDADAVAAVAEIMGQRSDEAEADAEPLDLIIARRAAGARERRDQPEFTFQPRSDVAQRQIMLGAVVLDLAERHGLDEREIVALGWRTSGPSPRSHLH